MEAKINIAAILKDKPQGTKLYDWLYNIAVELDTISTTDTETVVWCTNETDNNTTCHRGYSEFGTVRNCPDGLQILLPSRKMRDWRKFSWKKGDVLVSEGEHRLHVIFEGFEDDTYTTFKGKHYLCNYDDNEEYNEEEYNDYKKEINLRTIEFEKDDKDSAQTYINTIEERLGGKMNMETLEIEKNQSGFKDGDILSCDEDTYTKHTTLILYKNGCAVESLVSLIRHHDLIESREPINDFLLSRLNYAREDEKKELFDALAKKGKTWDAEKKEVVDLKPKCEFKPFDRVITRNAADDVWTANIFSHMDSHGEYVTVACVGGYTHCLPYNEKTAKLIGTTDNWEG